jgi:hypothetical protein
MGWWSNFWDKIGHIFKAIFGWIANLIKWIADELKELRIRLSIAIAKWLEDDSNFVIALVVLIAGIYFLPAIMAKISGWLASMATSVLAKLVATYSINIEELRKLIDFQAMNSMAKLLWPDYRDACAQLNSALSSLAGELKLGMGYIHSYLAMCKGIVSGTAAIFGLPAESVEYDWFSKATEWSGKVEDRLDKYAHNPESMFSDIIDEVLIPMQTEYTETQQAQLDDIYEKIHKAEAIRDGVKSVEASLSTWIESLPDEIEAVFDRKIGPALEDVREAIDLMDREMFDKVNGIMEALQKSEDRFEEINRRVDEIKPDPIDLAAQHALMSDREKSMFAVWMTEAITPAIEESSEEESSFILPIVQEAEETIQKAEEKRVVIPSLSYEQADFFSPAGPGITPNASWFVGEF